MAGPPGSDWRPAEAKRAAERRSPPVRRPALATPQLLRIRLFLPHAVLTHGLVRLHHHVGHPDLLVAGRRREDGISRRRLVDLDGLHVGLELAVLVALRLENALVA